MAFRERTVTGFVVDADGTPINAGTLSFQLDKPLGYTSTHVVIDRIFTAVTTSLGAFTVTLWCDEDSLAALNYKVSFPIANSGQPQSTHTATISLAYQDGSPKDLGTLIAESQPPPSEVPLATWQALIEDTISAASLNDLSDVVITSVADDQVLTWDSGTSKWVNQAPGGGGITVGTTTSNGGANTILKTDGAGKVHNSALTDTGAKLTYTTVTEAATGGAFNLKFAGWNGSAYTEGFVIESTDAGAYFSRHLTLKGGGYGTNGFISTSDVNGLAFQSSGGATRFSFGNGSVEPARIGTSTAEALLVSPTTAAQIGETIKLFASQTADALQIQSSAAAVLAGRNAAGEVFQTLRTPASAAAAGSIGTVVWDTGFIYICTASNTWKRVAVASW